VTTQVKLDGWTVVRSRVSLAGRVTAADGVVASGGVVSLIPVLGDDARKPETSGRTFARQRDTCILGDGFYFFLDLPPSDYVLNGRDERGNEIEPRQVSMAPADGAGHMDVMSADLTTRGKRGADKSPLEEAKASVAPPRRRRGSRNALTGDPNA
jgi:hypothetical protein